jgi:hypothetical protein
LRPLVERGHAEISVRRQCELLGVNRSGLYYEAVSESQKNLTLMRLLDEQYTRTPFYGSRRMTEWLATKGHEVNRKRVSRLMALMGIEAVYPKPRLSQPGEGHRIYPYLLSGTKVERINQVWSTDIPYIRMAQGFVYLASRVIARGLNQNAFNRRAICGFPFNHFTGCQLEVFPLLVHAGQALRPEILNRGDDHLRKLIRTVATAAIVE